MFCSDFGPFHVPCPRALTYLTLDDPHDEDHEDSEGTIADLIFFYSSSVMSCSMLLSRVLSSSLRMSMIDLSGTRIENCLRQWSSVTRVGTVLFNFYCSKLTEKRAGLFLRVSGKKEPFARKCKSIPGSFFPGRKVTNSCHPKNNKQSRLKRDWGGSQRTRLARIFHGENYSM
jgi:hypothetical protein